MRHIGDEITAHAIKLFALGDVPREQQTRACGAIIAALQMKRNRASGERNHRLLARIVFKVGCELRRADELCNRFANVSKCVERMHHERRAIAPNDTVRRIEQEESVRHGVGNLLALNDFGIAILDDLCVVL